MNPLFMFPTVNRLGGKMIESEARDTARAESEAAELLRLRELAEKFRASLRAWKVYHERKDRENRGALYEKAVDLERRAQEYLIFCDEQKERERRIKPFVRGKR